MMKINEKLYEKFDVLERVNLTVAALARGDDEEINQLRRTCPKVQYITIDHNYTSRLDCLVFLGARFSGLCDYFYNKILLCQSCIVTYTLMNDLPIFAGENCEHNLEKLQQAKSDHIASLKSIHEALRRFCVEKGVDVNKVNEWIACRTVCDDLDNFLNSEVAPDNGFTDFILKKFLKIWDDFVK